MGGGMKPASKRREYILKMEGNIPFKEDSKVCALLFRQLMIAMNNGFDMVH